jgi:calcium-dependent protein kinase
MNNYMNSMKLKRTTLAFLASRLPEEQIDDLRKVFIGLDSNGDGTLTVDELKDGFSQVINKSDKKIALNKDDIETALKIVDSNNNNVIDYSEFIASCMYSMVYLKEDNLKSAFDYFDKDKSGKISREELKETLKDDDMTLDDDQVEKMINEADIDKDGEIDYNEFIRMMKADTDTLQSIIKD